LPDVVCECKIWSLTLREKYRRLRIHENRVLKMAYGRKRDE